MNISNDGTPPVDNGTDPFLGIKALAFDAFGTTCCGSSLASFLPWHKTLPASEQLRIQNAWMRGEIGPSDLVTMGDTRSAPPTAELEQQLRADFDRVLLYPDVAPVLEDLHGRGYRMVTISNLVAPFGEVLKQRLGAWMVGFALSYEVGSLKPDQRMFQAAAKLLELPPNNILVVGDSDSCDIRAARSLGMPSVLVDRHGRSADAISMLKPLLDRLPRSLAKANITD